VQANLLGDAMLEFVRATAEQSTAELWKNGDKLKGSYSFEPTQLIANLQDKFDRTINSVQTTSSDLGEASQKLTGTLKKIDQVLGDDERGIQRAVNQANDIMAGAKNVIGDADDQKRLRNAIQELPELITNMKVTIGSVNANLDNMEKFTEPLGERGESLFQNLDDIASRLSEFTDKLNRSEGTIGMMINNPELYQHMNRAAKNLEDLSRQLRPIVDDARVFSDKIARHPEVLGVKGVMQKGAGIK
jgi:phospholipid/cholesterol/gamma-HCH transport system substrate-binding protein